MAHSTQHKHSPLRNLFHKLKLLRLLLGHIPPLPITLPQLKRAISDILSIHLPKRGDHIPGLGKAQKAIAATKAGALISHQTGHIEGLILGKGVIQMCLMGVGC